MSSTSAIAPDAEPATPPAQGERIYFPELDGLRFFAFFLVYLFHKGIPTALLVSLVGPRTAAALEGNGWVGVQFFFILSGYLITTLLLREEATLGRIDLRAFWVRRILRIWPLYFLTLLITFGVMPALDGVFRHSGGAVTLRQLPYFLVFLGNWSMIVLGPVATAAQQVLWSVCVEEQFYVAGPLLIAFVPRRLRVALVLVLMAASIGTRYYLIHSGASQLATAYNSFALADTLLSGMLLALWLGPDPRHTGRHLGVWLRWLQWPLYAVSAWFLARPSIGQFDAARRVWDLVGIWVIGMAVVAIAVTVPGLLRKALAYPRLVWLGKVSYGLYMLHEVAFWLRDRIVNWLGWFPNQDYLVPIGTLALTVGLAAASYYGVERRFLRLKARWTRVESRPV